MDNVSANPLVLAPPPSALIPATKRCARAGCIKPFSAFNASNKKPDGLQPYCRECQDDDRLRRRYHCTRRQRDLMYERQRGQCAVCQGAYPRLSIYAIEGLGVLSLVCQHCRGILHGFHRNPAIVESAIDYLDYFRERALYGVARRTTEEWEASPTEEPPRRTRRRHYPRGVNPDTYEHWLLWNDHQCYICREPPNAPGRKLAKDHQHGTERNRGLLCFGCNTTLGMAKEDTTLLKACATFLTAYLAPYLARCVAITDAMVADAEVEAPWVSRAYSHVLSASQLL